MKKKMFDLLKRELALSIHEVVVQTFSDPNTQVSAVAITNEEIYDLLVIPPQKEMGHLAFGCFPLAKLLKKAPPQIAALLSEAIKKNNHISEQCSQIQNLGPYVNFFFNGQTLFSKILLPIVHGDYFKTVLTEEAPRSMIEYSQPNTHKELHVGHMRNICLGDSLVRILRYANYPVISTTFPGDVGTHVAKCLWYLKYHNQDAVPQVDKGEWLGRIYSTAHLKLEAEEGTPQEEKNRQQLTFILKQLEEKTGEFFDLWKETRTWSIDLMNQVYSWCEVHFDQWYWESDVDSESVKWVKELFAQGKLIESQGAIGLDLTDKKLGFCVLLKQDGNGLYATKDLELARRKFQDFKIEKNIYVVDTRQALHFQQVFATLEHLQFPHASGCFHLQYNFVELPDGAMSSRKGNIVPIIDLIQQMEDHVKTQYLSRYENEWSADEIHKTAAIVAKGAVKYGMLKMDPNKKIVFDMKEWLKLEGDTGPYIQYAYARIQSILKKFEFNMEQMGALVDGKNLTHSTELQLTLLISQLNTVICSAAESYRPSVVCNYLYDVAKQFSQFYADCSIGYAETPEIKNARLYLAYATGLILKNGLAQLGIPVPDRM